MHGGSGGVNPTEAQITAVLSGPDGPVQMINLLKKQKGVKAEEIEFLKLEEAFADKKSVTREELAAYVEENPFGARWTVDERSPSGAQDFAELVSHARHFVGLLNEARQTLPPESTDDLPLVISAAEDDADVALDQAELTQCLFPRPYEAWSGPGRRR